MTDQTAYDLSARSFSQAEMPLGFALRLYDAFSAGVQRKCTCAVPRSLAGKGGLPLPRFGASIADIMPTQIFVDKPSLLLFNVYTLNKEAAMEYISPKLRELQKERDYHERCISQYRDSAARIKNEKLSLRAMDNAQFHERKLAHVVAQIERVR